MRNWTGCRKSTACRSCCANLRDLRSTKLPIASGGPKGPSPAGCRGAGNPAPQVVAAAWALCADLDGRRPWPSGPGRHDGLPARYACLGHGRGREKSGWAKRPGGDRYRRRLRSGHGFPDMDQIRGRDPDRDCSRHGRIAVAEGNRCGCDNWTGDCWQRLSQHHALTLRQKKGPSSFSK